MTIFRQFVSIGAARPEIGRQAYLSGRASCTAAWLTNLSAAPARGGCKSTTPTGPPVSFPDAEGDYQLRALMTNETTFDRADLEAHVEQVVALFLNGAGQG